MLCALKCIRRSCAQHDALVGDKQIGATEQCGSVGAEASGLESRQTFVNHGNTNSNNDSKGQGRRHYWALYQHWMVAKGK